MRFGCCVNMVAGKDGIGLERIASAAAAGFDYFELPLAAMSVLSEREFGSLAKQVGESSIPCECCNSFFPSTVHIAGPEYDAAKARDYIKLVLSRASRLGAVMAGVGSGLSRSIPDGYDRKKGYDELVSSFRMIGDIAGEYGMMIAIEPLRSAETNMITKYAEAAELSDDVGLDNVKALVDFYHMAAEGDDPESISKYSACLIHAHFAYPALGTEEERTFPKSMDEWDYAPFFRALSEAGYDDRMSIEAYCHGDFHKVASKSVSFLHSAWELMKS